jgi:hypothetical protein
VQAIETGIQFAVFVQTTETTKVEKKIQQWFSQYHAQPSACADGVAMSRVQTMVLTISRETSGRPQVRHRN